MNGYVKQKDKSSVPLTASLKKNITLLKDTFEDCNDIVYHFAEIESEKVCLIYSSDIVHHGTLLEIEQGLLAEKNAEKRGSARSFQKLIQQRFPINSENKLKDMNTVVKEILSGNTILLVDNMNAALLFHSMKEEGRAMTEPSTDRSIKGPKEAFVEDIHTNVMLIRKKIRTPSLKIQQIRLGYQTDTEVSVAYIKGVANDVIVNEVLQRLSQIDIDGVLNSHYIASMITDSPKSPFPTVLSTERPDRVCGGLLEGKVAILIDGSPFVLSVPAMLIDFLKSSEDYYESSFISTTIRFVRFFGLFVALILPSFYIGLTTFHQDLLQTPFLIRIASSREDLPYPALVEAIFMLITFELIREAGLRMPKTLGGSTLTILGLLLIGQIAVQAGLIGPVMMIFISLTALVTFIIPDYEFHQVIRICGILLLLLTGMFGFMGLIIGLMFVLTHLVSLHSFGVPYFSPLSPVFKAGWKDLFIRAPRWAMNPKTPGVGINAYHREDNSSETKYSEEKKGDRR